MTPAERDRLILLGVCALGQVADESKSEPMGENFAVRAVLAFLFSCSDGDRSPFEMFWQVMRRPPLDKHDSQQRYVRATNARTAVKGIVRSLGLESDELFRHYVSEWSHGPLPHPNKTYEAKVARLKAERLEKAAAKERLSGTLAPS